jgi:hypothetical protein
VTPEPDASAAEQAGEQAAFRAFVREHHPDRGGDPAAFAAGLARFGRGPAAAAPETPEQAAEQRYDRPVEVVATLSFPVRVGVALIRTWHRRRNPRVR